MFYYVWSGLILLVLLYTVIPDLFLHRLGIGSWQRHYSGGVVITFDDGPNPQITPQILDIIDQYKVPAIFFVVGAKALQYPDLLKQIIERGHVIGAHSMQHKYAWFMSPWATWREWDKSVATITQITGQPVQYIRPPWGTFNLVTWLWLQIRHKEAVLWNVEGHDWQVKNTPAQIAARVLGQTGEGSIVVLHDAGGETGAPTNTLQALPIICQTIVNEQKLPLISLELPTWSAWRRLTFALWEKWEKYFARSNNVERINSTNILRLARTRYHGPDILNEEGQLMATSGDQVAEIHLDSSRLMTKETNAQKIGMRALHKVKHSFPEMVRYVAENPDYDEIKVFFAFTLLSRATKGFGFHLQQIPRTRINSFIGRIQKIVRWVYYPQGQSKKVKEDNLTLVWISKQELLARFGEAED